MKRNLVTLLMLIGIFSSYHAQVGINEKDPKASLHVGKISTTDTNVAEGVLIPRVTTAELGANTSYTKDQNGDLVFVTDDAIGATGSTENINGRGLYFYDGTEGKWKPAANSSSAYGNGSFTPVPKEIDLRVIQNPNLGNYIVEGINFFILTADNDINTPKPEQKVYELPFPKASDFFNQTIYIRNYAYTKAKVSGIKFKDVPSEFNPSIPIGLKEKTTIRLYSDGVRWYLMSGNFNKQW